MASSAPRASIYDLPEEILVSIVSFIAIDPPSIVHASEVPSELLWKTLEYPDLKNFSLVCRDWRRIAFPTLFSYLKIDLNEESFTVLKLALSCNPTGPKGVSTESAFSKGLAKVTDSVLLYVSSSISFIRPGRLMHLLRPLSPSRLMLVMEPHLWHHLMLVQVYMDHGWAFAIPHQSVEFRRQKPKSLSRSDSTEEPYTAMVSAPWNLLDFQAWGEMRVHGGNCLTNFGTCMCSIYSCVLLTFLRAVLHRSFMDLCAYTKPFTKLYKSRRDSIHIEIHCS